MKKDNFYFSKIEKLKKEIDEIFERIFGLESKEEPWILYKNYKEAKENMIRLGVLWLQLAIEDLLESFITGYIYVARKNAKREKMPKYFARSKRCKEIEKVVHKMKFITKVEIAENLNVITRKEAKMLEKLWDIRCKLAHNWILNKKISVKKGKGPKRRYRPFIEYNGKNLFFGRVFLEEFDKDYSKIFLKLFNQLPLE